MSEGIKMSEEFKDEPIGETPEETKPTDEKIEKKDEKVFTQEELDEIIQKRLDRAMSKAEEKRKKAEELAKLSEKERAAKELELKEQELEEERKVFHRERLELQTSKELDKINLPIKFTKFVIGEDADTTFENIKEFNELWETELEKRRIESMKGKTPTLGGKSNSISKEEFLKKGYKEQLAFKAEEPEAYNKIMEQ